MKKIILIRHAKSSWTDTSIDDFHRGLNERGKRDLGIMPFKLKETGHIPTLFYASTSKRTQLTKESFMNTLGINMDKNIEDLYHASSDTILKVIQGAPNDHDCISIVCHNPGITELCNRLSEKFRIDNVPTCGIVIFHSELAWSEWDYGNASFLNFLYPKKYK